MVATSPCPPQRECNYADALNRYVARSCAARLWGPPRLRFYVANLRTSRPPQGFVATFACVSTTGITKTASVLWPICPHSGLYRVHRVPAPLHPVPIFRNSQEGKGFADFFYFSLLQFTPK